MDGTGSRGASAPDGSRQRFPGALEVALPLDCEGWEELYPPHALFVEERREFDESRFWFQDAVHFAEPYYPFDTVVVDWIDVAFCQASARLFVVPIARRRVPDARRLRLPQPRTRSPTRRPSPAGLSCLRPAAATTTSTGTAHHHWRDKVEKEVRALTALSCPNYPTSRTYRSSRPGAGSDRRTGCWSPMTSCWRASTGSANTTWSCRISASAPTSVSTRYAGKPSPISRTGRSQRWWPASMCSPYARTMSASAWPRALSSSASPRRSRPRAASRSFVPP